MGLLEKITFWKKRELVPLSIAEFQIIEAKLTELRTQVPKIAISSFNQMFLVITEIYDRLGKLRSIEGEQQQLVQTIRTLLKNNQQQQALALTTQQERLRTEHSRAKKAIQLGLIKLKPKLDTLDKNASAVAQQIREALQLLVVRLGNEVGLTQEIIRGLLPQ